jgi:endonuclease/exonuclease/phosphatase (EEP) superfamily protein YafD
MPSYRAWIDSRIQMAKIVADRASKEVEPCLLAGDFNTPAQGVVYHTFADRFTDAFANQGIGWGFTFPGTRDGRLARFGPWLRLDYVFASRDWVVDECVVAPDARSQHRAVFTRLRLAKGS